MLELKDITKQYIMGENKQQVLKGISLNFRRKEFVSILGASGSGKTTLLNIIGGLDKYDSGDLCIEGVSTQKYNSEDWDSYRNNKIGFVFQNYNLIMHQSILANVELSLTLSGVSKKVRKERARKALEKVGLKDHINKLPNQLSGGQMQRVAIARAIVNDPEIILADEPTGALDSETSIQIMNILKEISNEKLVIMVTHNPELAKEYSTRIIELKDGLILKDSNPFNEKYETSNKKEKNKTKKTSMSFITSLELSFKNLLTKRGRTVLISIAGSIGIIGIALILSLSNGVQNYVNELQGQYMSNYPISLEKNVSVLDFFNMSYDENKTVKSVDGKLVSQDDITTSLKNDANKTKKNNLKEFKKFLESENEIKNYATEYRFEYGVNLQLYSNKNDDYVKTGFNMSDVANNSQSDDILTLSESNSSSYFNQLSDDDNILNKDYEILAGHLPKQYNEIVLIANENGIVNDSLLYALNIKDKKELLDTANKIAKKEEVKVESSQYSYDDILGTSYKVIANTDYYAYENGLYVDKSNDKVYMKKVLDNGTDLKIVGILKAKNDKITSNVLGYKMSLTEHIMEKNCNSQIAKDQLANSEIDVFTGKEFDKLVNTYEQNISLLGIASKDEPTVINIYPKDQASKDKIIEEINKYNKNQQDNNRGDLVITYKDSIKEMMSTITSTVKMVSYILIAFVAISLIVSSIMIAIITYISVLERTKEIGILRAIGARKKDISRVFNAETIIEGFISGGVGVVTTLLINVIVNAIANNYVHFKGIATLSVYNAIVLIVLSILLTLIAGLIPSMMASKKEPVEALRSE